MTKENAIKLFQDHRVRVQWDDEQEKWFFSIVDIVGILSESPNPRKYWSVLKTRLKKEGSELAANCSQLKMQSTDGKFYKTDVADTEQLLRLIPSIPSPKAEPFKIWLAKVGYKRIEETEDPEKAFDANTNIMKKLTLTSLFLLFFLIRIFPQDVPGCTDPRANNYDPGANVNDGSCTYDPTFYSPPFRYLLPNEVKETSGLLFWDNDFWTLNDSGNDPVIYRIDTTSGNIIQRITVLKASNVDWETMAQDDDNIYIGDVGNNSGNRDDLGIYIVAKAAIPQSGDASANSNHITFIYSDYPGGKIKRDDNNFDCEALICIDDSLYLFSKDWGDQKTRLYRLPKTPGDYTAELIYTFDTDGLVTGADYNEEAKEVTLIGYAKDTKIPFFWLLFGYHDNLLFSGNKRRIDLISMISNQSEGITYTEGKNGILSSEGTIVNAQSANNFSTAQWTDSIVTGVQYGQVKVFDFTLSPNPVSKSKLTVTLPRLPAGNYEVKIYDSSGKIMQIEHYRLGTKKDGLKIKLKTGHLKPGLYFVRMQSGKQILEKKFIKQ